MEINKLRELAKFMGEFNFSHLQIKEESGAEIILTKNVSVPVERVVRTEVQPVVTSTPTPQYEEAPSPAETQSANLIDIKSPIVGVFYASPSPDTLPFVSIGSAVKEGDVLGIIEAMKMMNEIPSNYEGIVEDICVKSGEMVDVGKVIFRIRV